VNSLASEIFCAAVFLNPGRGWQFVVILFIWCRHHTAAIDH
jgi:hypothetical protein